MKQQHRNGQLFQINQSQNIFKIKSEYVVELTGPNPLHLSRTSVLIIHILHGNYVLLNLVKFYLIFS